MRSSNGLRDHISPEAKVSIPDVTWQHTTFNRHQAGGASGEQPFSLLASRPAGGTTGNPITW